MRGEPIETLPADDPRLLVHVELAKRGRAWGDPTLTEAQLDEMRTQLRSAQRVPGDTQARRWYGFDRQVLGINGAYRRRVGGHS